MQGVIQCPVVIKNTSGVPEEPSKPNPTSGRNDLCTSKGYSRSLEEEKIPSEEKIICLLNYELVQKEPFSYGNYTKAVIYRVKSKDFAGEKVAKVIKFKQNDRNSNFNFHLEQEMNILRNICHPYIAETICYQKVRNYAIHVMELGTQGDLSQYIKTNGCVSEQLWKKLFAEIVSAIHYLHSLLIAHRDLKCSNIIVTEVPASGITAKLIDFGFAQSMDGADSLTNRICGTKEYKSPELLDEKPHNPFAADLWALGIVHLKSLTAKLIKIERYNSQDQVISTVLQTMQNHSQKATNIAMALLKVKPTARSNPLELASLAWFDNPTSMRVFKKPEQRKFYQEILARKNNKNSDNNRKNQ